MPEGPSNPNNRGRIELAASSNGCRTNRRNRAGVVAGARPTTSTRMLNEHHHRIRGEQCGGPTIGEARLMIVLSDSLGRIKLIAAANARSSSTAPRLLYAPPPNATLGCLRTYRQASAAGVPQWPACEAGRGEAR